MKALILGGAGFIGSNITQKFVQEKYKVTVLDGLLSQTGGNIKNLTPFIKKISFINKTIENYPKLKELISKNHIIIDCMGWVLHHKALENPIYDLQLNCESHLHLIQSLPLNKQIKIFFLGSRGQYGRVEDGIFNENARMVPEDIQGIHKLTAESYFRIYAKISKLNILSLRIPNCFGPNQLVEGSDIGLLGLMVRDVLDGKDIEIYGSGRKRSVLFVKDLTDVIFRLTKTNFTGFNAYNISGKEIFLENLAQKIITLTGKGFYKLKPMPKIVQDIDIGQSKINDTKLRKLIGKIPRTDIDKALTDTIDYFKYKMQ